MAGTRGARPTSCSGTSVATRGLSSPSVQSCESPVEPAVVGAVFVGPTRALG